MRRGLAVLASCWALACAHHVDVAVPPSPAVTLRTDEVAVIASDRACRQVADALVMMLQRQAAIAVNPDAAVQLFVSGCEQVVSPTVDVQQRVEARSGVVFARRRLSMDGRAHAFVTVSAQGLTQAHLLGSGRAVSAADWGAGGSWITLRHAVQNELVDEVAADLTEQMRPVPRLVARRVYPNASPDSPRDLHNRAVAAERAGSLPEALRLARLAHEARPSPRSLAYLRELDDRVRQNP